MNDILIRMLSVFGIPKRRALYEYARQCIGRDMAPQENEFGCAEAVTTIIQKLFPNFLPVTVSTLSLYRSLKTNRRFTEVRLADALPGDIIVSPTGLGNGAVKNGHTGIIGANGTIMSNNSSNGLWEANYTIEKWKAFYCTKGGFPVFVFRVLY